MDIRSIGNTGAAGAAYPDRFSAGAAPAVVARPAAAPVQADAAVQQPGPASDPAQVADALKSINKTIQALSPGLEFTLDNDSEQTIVKVVDTATREVIRQLPSKEALEIAKALDRVQGLLIRQKA